MRALLASALSGALFALGLAMGGMTQPAKIVGFLDAFGEWDPSLAFVMAGAVGSYSVLYRWILRRSAPLFALQYAIPTRRDLNARLLVGAAVFGAGWGLAGFCPGPGLVAAGAAVPEALTFCVGLLLGMGGHAVVERWRRGPVSAPPAGSDDTTITLGDQAAR